MAGQLEIVVVQMSLPVPETGNFPGLEQTILADLQFIEDSPDRSQ